MKHGVCVLTYKMPQLLKKIASQANHNHEKMEKYDSKKNYLKVKEKFILKPYLTIIELYRKHKGLRIQTYKIASTIQ